MSKLQHKVECLKPDEDDEWRKGTLPPTQPPLAEGGVPQSPCSTLKAQNRKLTTINGKEREIGKGTQTETETVAGAAFAAAASGKDIWQCA